MFEKPPEPSERHSFPICPYCNNEVGKIVRHHLGDVLVFSRPKCAKILAVSESQIPKNP